MATEFRLAEVLGALSLGTDMGAGQPAETALGATVLSVRIGTILGLSPKELCELYFTSITRFLGCSSTGTEAGALGLGDDGGLSYALSLCDYTDAADTESWLVRKMAPYAAQDTRADAIATVMEMREDIPQIAAAHCDQARVLVARLPLPNSVPALLGYMYNRWDGKYPGAKGADIPIAARIITLAVVAEHFRRAGGAHAALEIVGTRAGEQLDPDLCHLLTDNAAKLFAGLDGVSNWDLYMDAEPAPHLTTPHDSLVLIAETYADYVDQKSSWFLGHSRQVATLAYMGAVELNLDAAACEQIRIAGLTHDIGRAAVPNGIWDKPGPLTITERRRADEHSYQTERILGMAPVFNDISSIAAAAHTRAEGGRYHRHGQPIDLRPGVLAAADVYVALTHDRPWRPAYPDTEAAEIMIDAVDAGILEREPVRAILSAAGHGKKTTEQVYPAGLTQREADVLGFLARGAATKEIAAKLDISPKTTDHHIQKVYDKTGARGRTAAALYALQNGIVAP